MISSVSMRGDGFNNALYCVFWCCRISEHLIRLPANSQSSDARILADPCLFQRASYDNVLGHVWADRVFWISSLFTFAALAMVRTSSGIITLPTSSTPWGLTTILYSRHKRHACRFREVRIDSIDNLRPGCLDYPLMGCRRRNLKRSFCAARGLLAALGGHHPAGDAVRRLVD
ncbi:hypothetical protein MRX96_037153 [Rhipicephalus microplus]